MLGGDWTGILQSALVVGVIVAGAFAGLQRGTIQSLRGDNSDLRQRLDDRDKERAEDRGRIAELETSVRVLQDTVTAKDAIADLQVSLNAHHGESMGELTAIREAVERKAS